MSHLENGIYGAKIQSWRSSNPRNLLRTIMQQNPKVSEERLLSLLCEELDLDKSMQKSVNHYWLANNYRSLMDERRPVGERQERNRQRGEQMAERTQAASAKINAKIEEKARFLFLNTPMPNGKAMRYCTGKEMGGFGALYSKIAKAVKPNQRVGDVFRTDDEVMKLYKP